MTVRCRIFQKANSYYCAKLFLVQLKKVMTLDMACILVFPFDIMLLQRFQALFSLQCFQAECVKNESPPIGV